MLWIFRQMDASSRLAPVRIAKLQRSCAAGEGTRVNSVVPLAAWSFGRMTDGNEIERLVIVRKVEYPLYRGIVEGANRDRPEPKAHGLQ